MVKNLSVMQETRVWSLGQEDPLEKGTATHSSILAWRIPMDRGDWWATVFTVKPVFQSSLFAWDHPQIVEKAMAPNSSTFAWKIPWTEEPGRLQSMGSLRVRHDWVTSLSLFTFMHWRRKWQPTPVFLPGESQGWRSLVGCRLWGRTESDTTEAT